MQVSSLEKYLLLAAGVCGCILLWLYIAGIQFDFNDNMDSRDQSAYMVFARKAYESGFRYTGDRARMPLFPWLTALLYSPEMTDEEFFATGKHFNVMLSLLLALALGAAFFVRFSRLYAGYASAGIAFLVFAIKAPWVQADLLYYGFLAFAFILSLSYLSAPTWWKALAVGLLFGLAHFSKASALPAMIVFCSSPGVACLIQLLRRQLRPGVVVRAGSHVLLAVLAFLAVLFPYFQESHEKFGSHFYNVNTTFYIWYDSWSEVLAGTRAAGDRVGYPDLPPEEIPTLQKYLREHTMRQIVGRFADGAQAILSHGCVIRDSDYHFSYCSQVAAGLVMLAFSLPVLLRRFSSRQMLEVGHIIFFVLALFLVTVMGAFWFSAITEAGPRFILTLIVPFFWLLGLVVHADPVQQHRLRFGEVSVNTFQLVYGLLSLALALEIYLLAAGRAATLHGGS